MPVESRDQSVLNVMGCIRVNTIVNSPSVAKQISRLILQGLKQNKRNHVPILSSAQTIEAITKQILTYVCFENIGSIESGI